MIGFLRRGAALGLLWLCAGAAPAASAELLADAEAGGGYDSNLNAAASGSDAEGDGFGFATGAIGVTSAPGAIRSHLLVRWSGVAYADYSDLSMNRVSLEGGVRARPTDLIMLWLSPSLGGSFYGDADRDSFDLGIGVGARFEAHPRLSIDPGYSFILRDADVSEFDRTVHRLSLAASVRLWKGGFARATTALEFGQVVRYLQEPAGGGGGGGGGSTGRGRPNDTFGSNLIADRESATSGEITLSLEQEISSRIFAAVGGGYAHVGADPSDYDVFFANASLGIRWP